VFESYEYNGEGQVTAHRAPRGVLRRSTFRGGGPFAGAEEFVTRPGRGETLRNRISYETDPEGRLLRTRDHFGRTVTRAYDAAGRLGGGGRRDGPALSVPHHRAGR